MTTPTNPLLPPDAIVAAAEALTNYPEPDCTGRLDCACGSITGPTVAALTAALPHIEAAVREQIAKDTEAACRNKERVCGWCASFARIAREGAAG